MGVEIEYEAFPGLQFVPDGPDAFASPSMITPAAPTIEPPAHTSADFPVQLEGA